MPVGQLSRFSADTIYQATEAVLLEKAIQSNEGQLARSGSFAAKTGPHTGRSPRDKYIVRTPGTESSVWWDANGAMSEDHFDQLHADFVAALSERTVYAQSLFAAADARFKINVEVHSERAWHALFARNLLIRDGAMADAAARESLTILHLPSFRADPERHGTRGSVVVALHLERGIVLIGGTEYAGEIKKSIFTYLNYALPRQDVLSMHCAASEGGEGTALFFGLSGTGKTTLSADPSRVLIGDDEHGWGENGIFNLEGGCYAKTIHLSPDLEPEIYQACNRFGAVLENVVLDAETRACDFDDDALTENTRGAYPLAFLTNASPSGRGGHPRNIIFLTADAFGVLPPISRLSGSQIVYHFLSGYTAKLAGTETGVTTPQATFSPCFGGPFMPRHPSEYAELLSQLVAEHRPDCWLLNTGWTGGPYGVGRRMPLDLTRRILRSILDGSASRAAFRDDRNFDLEVPTALPNVPGNTLNPRTTWPDKNAYDRAASELAAKFSANFAKLGLEPVEPVSGLNRAYRT